MNDDLLRRTADELEIRNVIFRLAMLGDAGDLNEYASLFTEDGVWEVRFTPAPGQKFEPLRGRASILAAAKQRRANGTQGPGTHMYHLILTTSVSLAGDSANARSYLAFLNAAQAKPEIALFTIYSDEFRRTAEGWRLAARYINAA